MAVAPSEWDQMNAMLERTMLRALPRRLVVRPGRRVRREDIIGRLTPLRSPGLFSPLS